MKKNAEANTAPGAPIAWEKPSLPEEVQPGYGFIPENESTEETFYYHSDHLGSTSYITDDSARVTQYTAYLPYGELLVDEHSSSEDMPYKFNGKELDEETGLYYYGARYMQPITSVWYGIDPLTEKYPSVSAYVYCAGNPVKFIDPDGEEKIVCFDINETEKKGKRTVQSGKIRIEAIKNYKEPSDQVHVWCHGLNEKQIRIYDENSRKNYTMEKPGDFYNYLMEKSKIFAKNQQNGKNTVIVLHSCESGKEGGFAQKVSNSAYFSDGDVIIAATDNVQQAKVKLNKKEIKYVETGVKNNGKWVAYKVAYKNGKVIKIMNGNQQPNWSTNELLNDNIKR